MSKKEFKKFVREINTYVTETVNHSYKILTNDEKVYNFLNDELESMKLFFKEIYFW